MADQDVRAGGTCQENTFEPEMTATASQGSPESRRHGHKARNTGHPYAARPESPSLLATPHRWSPQETGNSYRLAAER